jgi:hypothetical protein
LQAEVVFYSAPSTGNDGGLAHVVGAKRTDIPRELYVPWALFYISILMVLP